MIDIENVEREFDKYVAQFNPENGRIKLKIEHIKRVANMSREIAQNLNLSQDDIKLAETIGFFHDIGRFKQVEMYNTFSDKDSINHAELSAKLLFEDGLIEKFKIDEKYYKIIKIAVLNHNKGKIDEGLSEKELLFAKIIRDADKLDIFYTICQYDFNSVFWYEDFNCDKIGDIVMKQFMDSRYIHYSDIKCNADQIIIFYAYIYDLYFDFSLNYLKTKKYLDQFTDRVCQYFNKPEISKQVKQLLQISNSYLENAKENSQL